MEILYFLLFLFCWYLSGIIVLLVNEIFIEKQPVIIKDLPNIFGISILGPLLIIFWIIISIQEWYEKLPKSKVLIKSFKKEEKNGKKTENDIL